MGKILVAEGTEGVKVNAPIAVLLGDGEDASAAAPAPASTGIGGGTPEDGANVAQAPTAGIPGTGDSPTTVEKKMPDPQAEAPVPSTPASPIAQGPSGDWPANKLSDVRPAPPPGR
jgi:pyruvate/2-oxoglutarate dehydrogenase complex dihydrolipoamide acyltransferase (E2) component